MKTKAVDPQSKHSISNKKKIFDGDGIAVKSKKQHVTNEPGRYFDQNKPFKKHVKNTTKAVQSNEESVKSKKIIFNDDGEIGESAEQTVPENPRKGVKSGDASYKEQKAVHVSRGDASYKGRKAVHMSQTDGNEQTWYSTYPQHTTHAELVELKENELKALTAHCKNSFESEYSNFIKKNPSDAKWLQTALHKGTAKDRVNSGALLVHSNPLGNLDSLENLIGLCKVSNRVGSEVLIVLAELFMEALIPPDRKLLPLNLRGADWKLLRNSEDVSKEVKSKVYAYWHFEAELKDLYFEFLKNLQHCLQIGQDPVKSAAIVCASKLLCHGPEKEQLLLSMLVNKLGDPSNKIAAKALHHLSEVTFKHPNMCGVITNETEKLLFRNNISEQAQHFALCFLAQIAPRGQSDVCTKLVNICFALFKVLVKKGAVNSRTMQAILRCLQKAIVDAKPIAGTTDVMNKEMQDTIYRLVHLADIQISLQTLSLLLQLITVKGESSDRFYNALYKKMVDLNVTTIGTKSASQFFHIIHRAIHIDGNISRAMAFIKRLLQISLYMPAHMACGCLIVISKVLKSRAELRKIDLLVNNLEESAAVGDADLSRFDDDGEEKYEDVLSEGETEQKQDLEKPAIKPSWHHLKLSDGNGEEKKEGIQFGDSRTDYDPYHRVPAFAGAQFVNRNEFILLQKHFHPTCKVFSESVINGKPISYYGDPLRDFSLSHFLERFAFKNPKKVGDSKADKEASSTATKTMYGKTYTPQAGRAQPVQSLTKTNCTEEERFIFDYLEKKREHQLIKKEKQTEDDNDKEDVESVDDDEFEAYLDSLCPKTDVLSDDDGEAEDIDFLKEMGGDFKSDGKRVEKRKATKSKQDEDDSDVEMDDWSEQEEGSDASDGEIDLDDGNEMEGGSDDDEGSISLDEGSVSFDDEESLLSDGEDDIDSDEDDGMQLDDSEQDEGSSSEDEELDEPVRKKSKKDKRNTNTQFKKALKHSDDMSSLFAAADDFAELLEETGKDKRHGTSKDVLNADKSSAKQLKWEERRRQSISGKQFHSRKYRKTGNKNSKRK